MAIEREKILQAAQKYVDRKRYDRAIVEYQRLIADNPNDARTLLKIGDLQARMQAYPEAIATYDRVGQFYAGQGFALKAIAVYKQIRELIEKHVPQLADRYGHIVPKLAEIYAELGLTSDALAAYDEIATRFQKAGRDRDAIEVFRKMVALDATNPLPHLRLAEARCRVQALDDAIESFAAAADLLIKVGRDEDALKVFERILHFKQDPRYARFAAEIYLRRGGQQDAMQALAKLQLSFQHDPRDLDTLGLLAQAFTMIGQAPKAIEVQKEMARIARDLGQPELYRKLVNNLAETVPEDETVRALVRMSDPPPSAVDPDAEEEFDEADDISEISVVEVDDEPSGKARPPAASMPDVEVSSAGVEEIGHHELTDTNAHTARALSDADGFRQLKLYSKAVEILHIALELDPNSIALRERVIELLAEAEDREGTINAMVALGAIHLENGNPELAKPIFEQVLEAEPEHEEALRLIGQSGGEAPLPSFDLDEPASSQPPSNPTAAQPKAAAASAKTHSNSSVMEAIEIVLEEAEFYVARGMHDDATGLLLDQWARTPNHPLLREKLEELGINPEASAARRVSRPPSARPSEGNYDVGSSLDALDRASRHSGMPPGDFATEQVDVDQVFAKFKAGVKQQVSEGDSGTHYDLGVAYKEMGLLKDAIGEFELAARDPVKECMCYNMIGTIHLELGDLELAADAYLKGLGARSKTVEQEMNLYYDLGVIYEMTGNKEEALYYLKKIARRDPGYRDVQEKIAALEPKMSKAPAPTRSLNDDDEFDRAFGEMIKK
ncbi:MAG TPA: tetratricopeptide repeat protein [Polyangiaceae bacterium]|nr:tetratricopeptide repeat protein [Polyangiaceae bacterium]